ncbi:unnamed protein product [Acanthoscelides obtectus]|uniref:Ionotropic glutamate receptor C-terminal domain-containing protein n=1 Tax=Acanthoscelides obtectus TaxID=200917 RepID=A0A9P0JJF8_ACAOB|nr:unnamed protein product [Acanthoscelides obtectus]CAK1672805.1 hypothetical protein AOBTE_LOCUS29097 [Acanthoscelides obtectus]
MNDTWGEIYNQWTGNGWQGTGLLGNLGRDDADVGFASMATWTIYYDFLDFSKPSVRTGVTGLVPAPKLASRWLIPFYSYSKTMWLTVAILFFTCIIALFAIRYWTPARKNSEPLTNDMVNLLDSSVWSILKLFIVQPVSEWEIVQGFNGGLFMSLLFLASLFLSTTYSSGFSSIMTIPLYENPINTVMDFYESGLEWGATGTAWIESLRGAEDHVTKEIVRRFIAVSEEELHKLSFTYKFGFAMERLPNRNFAVGAYVANNVIGDYRVMVEDFYWEHCIFMLRKSSIFLPKFDAFLLRVFETGHINHWQSEAIMQYMDFEVQKIVEFYNYQHQVEHVVEKLTITHLEGAFAILIIGLISSTISFIIELFIYRYRQVHTLRLPLNKICSRYFIRRQN